MEAIELENLCKKILEEYPDKVNNYKLGKTGMIGYFTGEAMKRTKGSADPKELISIFNKLLAEK